MARLLSPIPTAINFSVLEVFQDMKNEFEQRIWDTSIPIYCFNFYG